MHTPAYLSKHIKAPVCVDIEAEAKKTLK